MGARVPASQGQNAKRSRNQAAEPPPQESISTPTNSKSVATTKETAEENQENYVKNKSLLYWTFAPCHVGYLACHLGQLLQLLASYLSHYFICRVISNIWHQQNLLEGLMQVSLLHTSLRRANIVSYFEYLITIQRMKNSLSFIWLVKKDNFMVLRISVLI